MTKLLPSFSIDPFAIGFDKLLDSFNEIHDQFGKSIPNYPPYNIKKVEDNKYLIELAVAGFSKTDLELTIDDNKLIVKGTSKSDDSSSYIHKGIADRAFTRTFTLADSIEIRDTQLINGMLKVFLENIIPESKKPKKLEIKDAEQT